MPSCLREGPLLLCIATCSAAMVGSMVTAASQNDLDSTRVLVIVNGESITEGDLGLVMLSHRIPENLRGGLRDKFLEQLIEKRLLQHFLDTRKAKPNPKQLDAQVETIRQMIRRKNEDPDEILARLGYTFDRLRAELALPLVWKSYVRRLVTPDQLRAYWAHHRTEFDGTRLRAAHIVLKAKTPEEFETAEQKLRQIRAEIVDGVIRFAEAAKRYSDGPSRDKGGDLGFFSYHGQMLVQFSQAAFPLKIGDVSQPVRTPFGVHLLTVTDRKPGQLNLEDVRDQVLDQMGEEIRRDVIARERAKARIEWKITRQRVNP